MYTADDKIREMMAGLDQVMPPGIPSGLGAKWKVLEEELHGPARKINWFPVWIIIAVIGGAGAAIGGLQLLKPAQTVAMAAAPEVKTLVKTQTVLRTDTVYVYPDHTEVKRGETQQLLSTAEHSGAETVLPAETAVPVEKVVPDNTATVAAPVQETVASNAENNSAEMSRIDSLFRPAAREPLQPAPAGAVPDKKKKGRGWKILAGAAIVAGAVIAAGSGGGDSDKKNSNSGSGESKSGENKRP